jgi:hypothetical protein
MVNASAVNRHVSVGGETPDGLLRPTGTQRRYFLDDLRRDAHSITDAELNTLLRPHGLGRQRDAVCLSTWKRER